MVPIGVRFPLRAPPLSSTFAVANHKSLDSHRNLQLGAAGLRLLQVGPAVLLDRLESVTQRLPAGRALAFPRQRRRAFERLAGPGRAGRCRLGWQRVNLLGGLLSR